MDQLRREARAAAYDRPKNPARIFRAGRRADRGSARADGGLVDFELLLAADLVGELVPALLDGLYRGFLVDFPGQEAGNRLVQNHLLISLVLRNAQVQN